MRFSTEWQFAADRFSLHKTKLDAPGIALSGTLDALPAKRRLDGGFRLAVTDWAALSSLTGVPLDGSAAVANVSFFAGQNAAACRGLVVRRAQCRFAFFHAHLQGQSSAG